MDEYKLTPAQAAFLERNSHLVTVEQLADGDLLCLDRGVWKAQHPSDSHYGKHFGPYILTGEGYVQDVTAHYQARHGVKLDPLP